MELDKAFQLAVVLAWEDLLKPIEPRSVRVEYFCEPGTSLDCLEVWSVGAGGRQDLVCRYWTSSAPPSGVRFGDTRYCEKLAQALDFIMKNQGQFTRRADACSHGLVLIYPPDGVDRTEAATWMRGVDRTATNIDDAADQRVPLSRTSLPYCAKDKTSRKHWPSRTRISSGSSAFARASLLDAAGYSRIGGRLHLVGSPIF